MYARMSAPVTLVLSVAILTVSGRLMAAAPTGGNKDDPKTERETQAAERPRWTGALPWDAARNRCMPATPKSKSIPVNGRSW